MEYVAGAARFVASNREAVNTVAEIGNLGLNFHQSNYIRRQEALRDRVEEARRQEDRELRDAQRQREIVERAEDALAMKLLEIYDNSKSLVKKYSLTDTEFHIDRELFKIIIKSVQNQQEKRYDDFKIEVEKWWTPCARSKAKVINDELKEKADRAIDELKQCIEKLHEFALQQPGYCNYGAIHDAIKKYNSANSNYIWAKAIGIKAIESKQLTEGSVKRAEEIIDNSDRVLERFKEKIDAAKVAYAKKAVKAIYDGQEDLNLSNFYLDKIKDLREQGINISETEMKFRADKMAISLINCVNEQKEEDIKCTQDNVEQYRDILRHLTSSEDLDKPDIKSYLDSIRLPSTIKNNIADEWLRDLNKEDRESVVSSWNSSTDENNSNDVPMVGDYYNQEE